MSHRKRSGESIPELNADLESPDVGESLQLFANAADPPLSGLDAEDVMSESDIAPSMDDPPPEGASFSELGLDDWIIRAINSCAISRPTPVQQKCIPPILQGRDVVASAETGSGKCFGKGTEFLVFAEEQNGMRFLKTKNVEELVVGDALVGDDGSPRWITSVNSGIDDLFRIQPLMTDRMEPFVCNSDHILVLDRKEVVEEIPLSEFMKRDAVERSDAMMFTCNPLSLTKKSYSQGWFRSCCQTLGIEEEKVDYAASLLGFLLSCYRPSLSATGTGEVHESIAARKLEPSQERRHFQLCRLLGWIGSSAQMEAPTMIQMSVLCKKENELLAACGTSRGGSFPPALVCDELPLRSLVLAEMTTCGDPDRDDDIHYSLCVTASSPSISFRFFVDEIGRGEYFGFTVSDLSPNRRMVLRSGIVTHNTMAFALPIVQRLSENPFGIFALILTPTRELAFQIRDQFSVIGASIGLKQCVVVGGLEMHKQAIELSKNPHVVIATPGRLLDHLRSSFGAVRVSSMRFLVMDEADRLLYGSLRNEVAKILDCILEQEHAVQMSRELVVTLPAQSKAKSLLRHRQNLLFSATMTPSLFAMVSSDVGKSRNVFSWAASEQELKTVKTLRQRYLLVPDRVREVYLVHLLRLGAYDGKQSIVFCESARTCQILHFLFAELSIQTAPLHSFMSQARRLASLGMFRSQRVVILVATDVASRGLDIPSVDLVINFNIPANPRDYVHRVGRTARVGRQGESISFCSQHDVSRIQAIESRIEKKLEEFSFEKESELLESLTAVSTAKRLAMMKLIDSGFGDLQESRKKRKQN